MHTGRRWFPGYSVAAASTVAYIATAPGQTFVVSQLNASLREAFGIQPLTLNTMYTVATVAAAFPLVYMGALTDRLGPRRMLALTALAFGLGCLAMAHAAGLVTVFLGFFLLRLLGQGTLSLVSQHALAMWFHRRLGAMHGFKMVLTFAAWVPVPSLAIALIKAVGWRHTYEIFAGAIPLLVVPTVLWLVRDRPEDLGLRMDGDGPHDNQEDIAPDPTAPDPESAAGVRPREPGFTLRQARRTRAYWILAAIFFFPPLIGTAFIFDMQPMLTGRGLSQDAAALVVGCWSATMAILALPSGWLTDRLRPRSLLALSLTLVAISCLLLMPARSVWAAGVAMVVIAAGHSVGSACGAATVARFFGRANHGAIRSSLTRVAVLGTGLGPVCFGLSVRFAGGYTPALVAFALVCLPVVVGALTLRPPPAPRP
jgi:sugar phosphate permease